MEVRTTRTGSEQHGPQNIRSQEEHTILERFVHPDVLHFCLLGLGGLFPHRVQHLGIFL